MAKKRSTAWKMERASVSRRGTARPRSNRYRKSDEAKAPEAGSRVRIWVGGYTRGDGTRVEGYYRSTGA
jgi:hypothetical protein